jgi:hypothetical protein
MTSWSTKKKRPTKGSPCSHLPSFFRENFRHCPSSLEKLTLQKILYSFPVVLLWNTCACCNWRQHLQRLSPHGLHWPTVDEGLATAALTSVSLMLLGHRNAITGGSGNNLANVSLFSIYFQWWRTMPEIFSNLIQPTISLEMPVPSQGHYGFHSFPVVDWFCLFIYLWVLTFPL